MGIKKRLNKALETLIQLKVTENRLKEIVIGELLKEQLIERNLDSRVTGKNIGKEILIEIVMKIGQGLWRIASKNCNTIVFFPL